MDLLFSCLVEDSFPNKCFFEGSDYTFLCFCHSLDNKEKIKIKVQYVCGRMNLDLEKTLEERFPDVDIITDELVGDADYIIAKELEYGLETTGYERY